LEAIRKNLEKIIPSLMAGMANKWRALRKTEANARKLAILTATCLWLSFSS